MSNAETATEDVSQDTPRRPFIEPGWYRDMSNEDYHGSFGFSSSQLKVLIEKTPAHLLQSFSDKKHPTDNMNLGTAVHTLVLEPEKFEDEIAVMPVLNLRTKDGRAQRDNFEADNVGKTTIKESDLPKALAMAESVRSHPMAALLLEDIVVESSVYWWYRSMDPDDDSQYKSMLKVRPDALSVAHPVIIDLKTRADASYSGFIKAIQNFYYHVSAAMYLEGVNQCRELLSDIGYFAYTKFVFVCVENTPPYCTALYELPPEYLDLGKTLYRRSLRTLRTGLEEDWPGYPEEIRMIEPPSWASRGFVV